MVESELFTKGLETRRQVLGAKYVDANLAGSDEFMMTFQRAVTELAWGYAWSRPGLDRKARSILDSWHPCRTRPLPRTWHLHECCDCQRCNDRRDQRSFGSDNRLLRDARGPPGILGRA